ncbi:MAG: hypothetical protein KGY81_10800, partial [Phycisphaerae bacterium]|nr:hypothetical protein [Phycisphaerae bacterium]
MKANLRTSCVFGLTVAACITVGCKPEPVTTTWQNPLDTIEKNVVPDPDDVNYVLTRMEFARAAVRLGCPMRAEPKLLEAYEQLDVDRENTAAALSSEKYKYYKGETYERAMLCMYLGLIRYNEGKYNDARILFSRALTEDQKAVVEEDTPSIIGEDFALAYYWLSRAYAKLSQADNARI